MRCEKDFVGPDGGNLLGETARFRADATDPLTRGYRRCATLRRGEAWRCGRI